MDDCAILIILVCIVGGFGLQLLSFILQILMFFGKKRAIRVITKAVIKAVEKKIEEQNSEENVSNTELLFAIKGSILETADRVMEDLEILENKKNIRHERDNKKTK